MNNLESVFFKLLSTGLWGNDFSFPEETLFDWPELIKLAKQQSVLPLIADPVLKNSSSLKISEKQISYLQKFLFLNFSTHQRINNVLVKVTDKLLENDVPYVLLKGQGLASLYHNPELRTCGDIDLYVGEKNIHKAVEIVNSMVDDDFEKELFIKGKHHHAKVNGITIELHRRSADMPTSRMQSKYIDYVSEAVKDSNLDSFNILNHNIRLPEATFNLFFTFFHAWHHFSSSGVGFRQLCDIAVFLYRKAEAIDVSRLREILLSLDLMMPWQSFMFILVNYLGMDRKYALLYSDQYADKAEKMVRLILLEGNFGQYRKDNPYHVLKNVLAQKSRTLFLGTRRSIKLLSISPAYITKYYFCSYVANGIKKLFGKDI